MELFGLSPIELAVIAVVAILVFGQRLPQVAGEAAATLQRVKRALSDLRRETGIDQEIYRAKREFEEASRKARSLDPVRAVQREAGSLRRDIDEAVAKAGARAPAAPETSAAAGPARAASGSAAAGSTDAGSTDAGSAGSGSAPPETFAAEPPEADAARPLPARDPSAPRRD